MYKLFSVFLLLGSSVLASPSTGDINNDGSVDASDASVMFEFWGANTRATVVDKVCYSENPVNPEICNQFQIDLFATFPNGLVRTKLPPGPVHLTGFFDSFAGGSLSSMTAYYHGQEAWDNVVDWSAPIDSVKVFFYNMRYTSLGDPVFTTIADSNNDLIIDSSDARIMFQNWSSDVIPVPEPTINLFTMFVLSKFILKKR